MKIGAVIVAAGMSKRMGDFKPLLKVGDKTLIEREIECFHECGINEILIVTGYRADELEDSIRHLGVDFVRNEKYETTQMFDSVCLGLELMKDKVDRILFTPSDVMFSADTVQRVIDAEGALVVTMYEEVFGHPIRFDTKLIPKVTCFKGEGGLRAAMEAIPEVTPNFLHVQDVGAVMDADTPEDYELIQYFYEMGNLRPLVRVELAKSKPFLNPELILLLVFIDRKGSVLEACKLSGVSYSKGRKMIKLAEEELGVSLVDSQAGGVNGGKSSVTSKGRRIVRKYQEYIKEVGRATFRLYNESFRDELMKITDPSEMSDEDRNILK